MGLEVVSLVMNDYLGLRDLESCQKVCKGWRWLASNALELPRLARDKASRTIARAWKRTPRRVRGDYAKDVLGRIDEGLGEDWKGFYLTAIDASRKEVHRSLLSSAFPGGGRALEFSGTGVLVDEATTDDGSFLLSGSHDLATNFRATWLGAKRPIPLTCGSTTISDVLEFPDALIPVCLLKEHCVLVVPPEVHEFAFSRVFLPGRPKVREGPLSGLPGYGVRKGRLVRDPGERIASSSTRILGRYAEG